MSDFVSFSVFLSATVGADTQSSAKLSPKLAKVICKSTKPTAVERVLKPIEVFENEGASIEMNPLIGLLL